MAIKNVLLKHECSPKFELLIMGTVLKVEIRNKGEMQAEKR